jgi:hypothetical protein
MANSENELYYKVKFEADQESAKKVGQDLQDELAKSRKKPTGGKSETDEEVSALKELRQSLKEYQEELAEVQKQVRLGDASTRDLTETQRTLSQAISETRSQIQEATRGYADQQTILSAIPTTYNQLVEQNRALSIAMRDVPLSDTTGQLQRLQTQYNENNERLKQFDASIGNSQRNVGNYENSIRAAANALAVFQGPLGPIAGRINAVATVISRSRKANEEYAVSWAQMTTAQRVWSVLTLQNSIPTLKASATATKVKTASVYALNTGINLLNLTLRAFKIALAATGIGLILVALGSLVAWFRRTEEGAEALRVRMAGFRAVLNVLLDRFSALGKFIFDAFNDPKQAVADLWQAIKTNIMNRLQGVVDAFGALGKAIKSAITLDMAGLTQAGKDFGNAWVQALTGVEDLYEKIVDGASDMANQMRVHSQVAKDLQERMNEVLRTERALGVERARQNRDLQEARDLARDLTVDYDERLAALQAVRQSELGLMEQEIANERTRLAILETQAGLADSNSKVLQEVADQQAKLFEMEQKHLERSISLRRDETAIIRQRDEFQLRSLRNIITEQERSSNLAIRRVEREMRLSGQQVELALLEQRAFEDKLEQEKNARFLAYRQEYLNQKFDDDDAERMATLRAEQELETELIQLRENTDDAIMQRQRANAEATIEMQRLVAERTFNNEIAIAVRKNDEISILNAERAFLEDRRNREREFKIEALAEQFRNQNIDAHDAMRMAELQIDEQYAIESEAIERRLLKARFDMQQKQLNAYINLSKNAGEAIFGENKALAVSGAIMDTYSGATAALGMRPWTPLNYVNAAAVLASGVANVRKILAVKKDEAGSVSATAPQAPNVGTSFGLVDTGTNMNAMMTASEMGGSQFNQAPTFIFEGDLNPEMMAIKVRQGNNSIAGRTVALQ